MNPRRQLRRPHVVALLASVSVVALACGLPAVLEDPPDEMVKYEEVLGLWEDGKGNTIEFREDGTFTAEGATFGSGSGEPVPGGTFEGTWSLCYDFDGFEGSDDGADDWKTEPRCGETGEGQYLVVQDPTDTVHASLYDLIFTGDDELEMYPYWVDVGPEDDDFYARAK